MTLLRNLLINMHYLNALLKVTLCPTKVNSCTTSFRKTLVSSIADLTSTRPSLPPPAFVKHYIDTGNAIPIKWRAYHTSHYHRKETEKQVKEMLQNGIIQPSISSWPSPVVLVRKADKTLQLCLDYRNLNKATIKDSSLYATFKILWTHYMVTNCSRHLTS